MCSNKWLLFLQMCYNEREAFQPKTKTERKVKMRNAVTGKRALAVVIALVMAFVMFPATAFASGGDDADLIVTIFGVGDFHGHMTSEQSDSDPGAPRFVTFMDERVAY